MKLALTLVTQDHGAVTELAKGKIWPPADVTAAGIVIQVMYDIPTSATARPSAVNAPNWTGTASLTMPQYCCRERALLQGVTAAAETQSCRCTP